MSKTLLFFFFIILHPFTWAIAQSEVPIKETPYNSLRIGLKNGTSAEIKAREQLINLVRSYPLGKWIYSDTLVIDESSIPHSHPVLTLNTGYLDDDGAQLANLLHEQFHWLVSMHKEQLGEAISRFENQYPGMPENLPQGARGRYSGYLHLVVCDLVFQAMTQLLGELRAKEIMKNWRHYTWIYDKVLNDKIVRRINMESGFLIE